MQAARIGIREFRAHLTDYITKSDKPTIITRNGDAVGWYIPTRPKTTQSDMDTLKKAVDKIKKMMAHAGVGEEEFIKDFKRLRSRKKI